MAPRGHHDRASASWSLTPPRPPYSVKRANSLKCVERTSPSRVRFAVKDVASHLSRPVVRFTCIHPVRVDSPLSAAAPDNDNNAVIAATMLVIAGKTGAAPRINEREPSLDMKTDEFGSGKQRRGEALHTDDLSDAKKWLRRAGGDARTSPWQAARPWRFASRVRNLKRYAAG